MELKNLDARSVGIWLLLVALLAAPAPALAITEADDAFVQGLRSSGMADLSIDYLGGLLSKPGIREEERADIEFEIAASTVFKGQSAGDLNSREGSLEEAATKFRELLAKYPNHPRKAEALFQTATVAMQKGRLFVLRAQLPSNAGQSDALVTQARELLANASKDYESAFSRLSEDYKKLPIYLPPEAREQRQQKRRLDGSRIEARFQSALASFYLADSYVSVEPQPPADSNADVSQSLQRQTKAEWTNKFNKLINDTRSAFETIAGDHRRELAGLYAQLWMARCIALQGDHRKAFAIYTALLEHDNLALRKFQRDAFYFSILSLAAQGEHEQILSRTTDWLSKNSRFGRESSFLGVQLEVARANIALVSSASTDSAKESRLAIANRILDSLSSFNNEFSGLARREQMRLMGQSSNEPAEWSFHHQVSLGNQALNGLKGGQPAAERSKLLAEARRRFERAIAMAGKRHSLDEINDAKLALVYTLLESGDHLSGAILAESVARGYPKTKGAMQAVSLGVTAYSLAYQASLALKQAGVNSQPEIDLARGQALIEYGFSKWADAKEIAEATITLARMFVTQQKFSEAIALLEKVGPNSASADDAWSLAGLAYWEWFRSYRRVKTTDPAKLAELRGKAITYLEKATNKFALTRSQRLEREVVLAKIVLADAYFDVGRDDDAIKQLEPIVKAVGAGNLPTNVEARLRIAGLASALQGVIRLGKYDEADTIVNLINLQKGQEESASVTAVFVNLATRLKDQLERLKAQGDQGRYLRTAAAFERFLDRLAEREAGQTLESLVFLASSMQDLEKYAKADDLLAKALAKSQTDDDTTRPLRVRAELLQARNLRLSGNAASAREKIDALTKVNPNAPEVLMERGFILEAAGDVKAAKAHWQWIVQRLKGVTPRRQEFYEALDHIVRLSKDQPPGPSRLADWKVALGYCRYVTHADPQAPEDWKAVFRGHAEELESALAGRK